MAKAQVPAELHIVARRDGGFVLLRPDGAGQYEQLSVGPGGNLELEAGDDSNGREHGWLPLGAYVEDGFDALSLAVGIAQDAEGVSWIRSVTTRQPCLDSGSR